MIWNYQHILYNLNTHNSSCSKHIVQIQSMVNTLKECSGHPELAGGLAAAGAKLGSDSCWDLGSGFRGWGLGVSRAGAELRYIVADVCLSSQKRLGFPEP